MRILIADDDAISRVLLEAWLADWGYDAVAVDDGMAAWRALQPQDAPQIAILDWMMPTMTGPEVCRALRAEAPTRPSYLIIDPNMFHAMLGAPGASCGSALSASGFIPLQYGQSLAVWSLCAATIASTALQ
jgi:CheY-like chemotaxis protein